jgi:hypothetical protein
MSDLKSALAGALATLPLGEAGALPPGKSAPAPPVEPDLPNPLGGEWGVLLRSLGVEIPRDATLGQLTQRSDARTRELAAQGRKREGERLRSAKEEYLRGRERAAWSLVKARFAELDLPEKAYRALRQEEANPERVLTRLRGRRGEELRGAGAARARDALLEG